MSDQKEKPNVTEGTKAADPRTFTKEEIQKIKDEIGPHARHTTGPEIRGEGKSKE